MCRSVRPNLSVRAHSFRPLDAGGDLAARESPYRAWAISPAD
jgi:hypothetical protein